MREMSESALQEFEGMLKGLMASKIFDWSSLKEDCLRARKYPVSPPPEPSFPIAKGEYIEEGSPRWQDWEINWKAQGGSKNPVYASMWSTHQRQFDSWRSGYERHQKNLRELNEAADALSREHARGTPVAIEWVTRHVLETAVLPADFPREFTLEYRQNEGLLIVDG